MRKPIEINSRVAARRGPFEPAALGRVRQQRALKFGNVVESIANNKFRIRWDDGTESCETTNVLKLQPTGAGALPQARALSTVPFTEPRQAMPCPSPPVRPGSVHGVVAPLAAAPPAVRRAPVPNPKSRQNPVPQLLVADPAPSPGVSILVTEVLDQPDIPLVSVQTESTPDGSVTVRLVVQSAAGSAGCSAASAATSSRATHGYDVFSPRAAIGYDGDDPNVDCDDPKELYYETPQASEEVVNESGGADSDDEQEGLGGQDLPLDCPVQSLLVEPITGTSYTVILSTICAGRQTVTWTVCGPDYDPPITTEDRAADLMRAAGGEATGLRGGLPYRDGALDLLALWLKLYPGDVVQDLEKLNDYALRTRTTFRPVTKSEWVRFWGLVLAARQFNQKGKALWADCRSIRHIRVRVKNGTAKPFRAG
eukprot:jgi/Tetstr1/431113/TSEL_020829.t1